MSILLSFMLSLQQTGEKEVRTGSARKQGLGGKLSK
jgi:hypothetical protein